MNPEFFTKTSFCGNHIDNITDNDSKKYILEQLMKLTGGAWNKAYAKVYNNKYSDNLKNPHIFFLKSSGTQYLMFMISIQGNNYSLLIDKRVKPGYDYPKIFILPYRFSIELYQGSLFECELIKDKNSQWSLSINDTYFLNGMSQKNNSIINRVNKLHGIFKLSEKSEFYSICPIFIKKYFDYKDIDYVLTTFIPNLNYDIRGIYLVPLRTNYSNILYLFTKDQDFTTIQNKDIVCKIEKTLKPDVYELSVKEGENYKNYGIALVQTIDMSHLLIKEFNKSKEGEDIFVQCRKNDYFNKWEPYKLQMK